MRIIASRAQKTLRYNPLGMGNLSNGDIRHALKVARDNGIRYVRIKSDEDRFEATLSTARNVRQEPLAQQTAAAAAIDVLVESQKLARSPVVGYFQSPSVSVNVGDQVEKGDVIAEVVALGLVNEVESPATGVVAEILVAAGDAVEYGQPLIAVEGSI